PSVPGNAITVGRRGINSRFRIWTACSCAVDDRGRVPGTHHHPASIDSAIRLLPAILLMGPTASGKSAIALELADRFPLEIISVDSAQVYRGMDIGTAKPDAATRSRVAHHLLDVVDPDEAYSAARFRSDALAAIKDVRPRGR